MNGGKICKFYLLTLLLHSLLPEQIGHSYLHLVGRLLSKSKCEDFANRYLMSSYQVCKSFYENTRLPRTRPCNNAEIPISNRDTFYLRICKFISHIF